MSTTVIRIGRALPLLASALPVAQQPKQTPPAPLPAQLLSAKNFDQAVAGIVSQVQKLAAQ